MNPLSIFSHGDSWIRCTVEKDFSCVQNRILPYCIIREKQYSKRIVRYVWIHSIRKTVGGKSPDDLLRADILKSAFDRHFTLPWGHGRGFMNAREATQLMLVGQVTVTTCWMQYIRIAFILPIFILYRWTYLFKGSKLLVHSSHVVKIIVVAFNS